MKPLERYSEPFSPTGNLAADGFLRLIGTPDLDLLSTVIREAMQNSIDATPDNTPPEIWIRLRKLSSEQQSFLLSQMLTEIGAGADNHDQHAFKPLLNNEPIWVLEICDFGAMGLGGSLRADEIDEGSDTTDFIDFIRNTGAPRGFQ